VVGRLNSSERVGTVLSGVKTLPNNPKEQKLQPAGEPEAELLVYVINKNGKPLMPCKPTKARHLLEKNKAKVVNYNPFTIQLTWDCEENVDELVLGIDAGYGKIGYSVVSGTKELIAGELELRNDIKRLLEKRRAYRRERRSRKWYREPRFDNRCRKDGWLPPSLEHKLQSHIKLIERLKRILPIRRVVVEVASFDTQKMQNPEIKGVEYQQGELQGYEVREYLLEKWNRKCAYCGKANVPLEIEHIIPKSRGGTDRVSNLTISCSDCNKEKGNRTAEEFGYPEIQKQAMQTLKATAFMNVIRRKLVNFLNCSWTYGSITKYRRTKLGLEKSHVNDAFVIAGGARQERARTYELLQTRRNNRSLQTNRRGYKPSIRRQRYKIQPNDLVRFKGMLCWVKGVFNYGKWVRIVTKAGEVINSNIKNVEMLKYGKGIQWRISST
jgi:5-methylcytosine-specific restriction endonuclease McrA